MKMRKTVLTFAITVFCFVTFYSLRQISRFHLQSASAEEQIAALDFFYDQQEEIILKNAQNDLDMLRNEYLFKLGCLNHIHNITRQERQARRDEINKEYDTIINLINSEIDSTLETFKTQIQKEKERLHSLRY